MTIGAVMLIVVLVAVFVLVADYVYSHTVIEDEVIVEEWDE